ncbi:hypothetical protein H6503_06315 [Candidatus Woesearchaeota archaeon]|nr:hypothetical protein [Candidatus Woesearchaeota archaeon]
MADKPVLPIHEGDDINANVDKYVKMNTPEAVEARRRRTDKHGRKHQQHIEDKIIGDVNLKGLNVKERKIYVANALEYMAKEWYNAHGVNLEKITPELMDAFLQQSIGADYNTVLKQIVNNEADLDLYGQRNQYLNALRERVSEVKDKEGLESQKLERTFETRLEYLPVLHEKLAKAHERKKAYHASASVREMLNEQRKYHARKLDSGYDQTY